MGDVNLVKSKFTLNHLDVALCILSIIIGAAFETGIMASSGTSAADNNLLLTVARSIKAHGLHL